ncbi:MAG: KaiC domain-containing protein [Thermoplasmata archaeon]|nr:MAG: KaiC domain-containing protein [Thermoplasmata archaeon]
MTKVQHMGKPMEDAVEVLGEAGKKIPKLIGLPTGVKGLDDLFFIAKIENGKVKKIPLGGYPSYGVIHITGVSDTGKSLMAEQFAIKQASLGKKVCFITVESPSPFLAAGLKNRAHAMGINWESIEKNIVLIDAASHHELREEIPTLLDTLAYAIKSYNIKATIIDSITGLYEAREMQARSVVRRLFNFMKKWYQTAIFVSQKRSSHEEFSAEAAGGYAISHIVDCTIVLSKEIVMSRFAQSIYKKPLGSMVRLFRIDGCRLCGHDTKTRILEITDLGLVEVGAPLGR